MAILFQGIDDKGAAFREILAGEGLEPHEVAYMGDDVSDLPVIAEAGLSAAPADAPIEVRSAAFMITTAPGGKGCLREFLEAILKARGDWDRLLSSMNGTAS
jgi:3-deoxy-D-manno-octulosonate 8-phosphate phosphatase (KDO 8-P phosphatase)